MRAIFISVVILACIRQLAAQNCAQTLRLARSTYDQGRLHDLPKLMEGCLNPNNPDRFTKQELVEAYKLLTMGYIYLEEPLKADSSMIGVLTSDHFFEPNQAVDPAEFIGLWKTFRTKPVFSWGLKGGLNLTQPNVMSNYYVGGNAKGNGQTSGKIGFQIGGVFEKPLFQRWKSGIWKRFTLAPEALFVSRSIDYANTIFIDYDKTKDPASQTQTDLGYSESQSWIDLNVMLQFKLKPKSKFDPFVAVGPGVGYMVSSSIAANTTRGNTGNVVTGANIDITDSYKKLVYSVLAGAGARYKVGALYLTAELRYQYGLINIVEESARNNPELTLDYAGTLNNYSISNLSMLVGVSVPVFKPQKLMNKKKK